MADDESRFSASLPLYNILPNPEPLKYAITLKLSSELFDYLTQDPLGHFSICFGSKQRIVFNGQSFGMQVTEENRQKPTYCLQESRDDQSFSKVGVIKQKFMTVQEGLRDEDIVKFQDSNKKIQQEKEERKIIQIDNIEQGRGRKRKATSITAVIPPSTTTKRQIPPSKPQPAKKSRTSATTATAPAPTTAVPPTAVTPTPTTSTKRISPPSSALSTPTAPTPSSKIKTKPPSSMPKFPKQPIPDLYSTPAPAPPKPKLALQPHLIQLLALDNLTVDQITQKRPGEGKIIISNILSKVASRKGDRYYLKPKFYKEVDLNWDGYTSEERVRVEDNVSNAAMVEIEQTQANAVSSSAKSEAPTTASLDKGVISPPGVTPMDVKKTSPEKPAEVALHTRKSPPLVQLDLEDESQSLKIDLSDHGEEDSGDDVLAASFVTQLPAARKASPVVEKTAPTIDNGLKENGQDHRIKDWHDYKKWKGEWERKYPLYCNLCKELEENKELFSKLGEELRNASSSSTEEMTRLAALIEKHYNDRNEEIQKKQRRYKKLHARLRTIKAGIVEFGTRSNGGAKVHAS